jgi:ATP-binding cassette subfamily F protein 3
LINDLRPSWGRGAVQGHLGRFGFSGDTVLRTAGSLSGGERARVALAMMMLTGANLLVFDEPTNHLDVESIEVLEDAIQAFAGTILLVSHDRVLLRALTTRTWVLHESRITDFPGGFEEWEVASAERRHAAAVAAAEEESVRRVHERQQTRRAEDSRKREVSTKRSARKALEEAEARVAECEGRISSIQARLENPALYTTKDGVLEAQQLGRELETARKDLDLAYQAWEGASKERDVAAEQRNLAADER